MDYCGWFHLRSVLLYFYNAIIISIWHNSNILYLLVNHVINVLVKPWINNVTFLQYMDMDGKTVHFFDSLFPEQHISRCGYGGYDIVGYAWMVKYVNVSYWPYNSHNVTKKVTLRCAMDNMSLRNGDVDQWSMVIPSNQVAYEPTLASPMAVYTVCCLASGTLPSAVAVVH